MLEDIRLRVLAGILILGALAMGAVATWNFFTANSWFVFGNPDSWEQVYESPYNNISFRHPDGVVIITPTNENDVPVSVVLKGERGASMLIQFGTLRRDEIYSDTDEAINDYEERFLGSRDTEERVLYDIQGRRGIALLQEEASGRLVGETFFYDPAVVAIPSVSMDEGANYEIREISLQLPDSSSDRERSLYTGLYLDILSTISFLAEPNDVPEGFANTWRLSENPEDGFSLLYPPDWEELEVRERLGMQETVFATTHGEINESSAEYAVAVMAGSTDAVFLETAFATPFRESAYPDTLEEERLVIPGVGEALSMQARQAKDDPKDGNEIQTLLLIVGGADTPQAGRGYVILGRLPDGANQQELRFEQVRAMTRSFNIR